MLPIPTPSENPFADLTIREMVAITTHPAFPQPVEVDMQPLRDALLADVHSQPKERLVKLARSMMRAYAHRLHKEQGGLCPLCAKHIDLSIKGEGVIDHDHDDGRIRGLLHRSCNAAEGKISNAAARWGAKSSAYADIIAYLENTLAYLKGPKKQFIYPMHKTPDERKDARNLKAREARAAVAAKRAMLARQRKETK